MSRLIIHSSTISLGGYGAGPHQAVTRSGLRMFVMLLLWLSLLQVFAQEERRFLPTRFTITLENGKRMESRKFTPEMQDAIGLKGIKAAQIRFKTGEVLSLEYQYDHVSGMSFQLGGRRCPVPDSVTAHISPYYIGTLELVWDRESKRASGASYFAIHYMRQNEGRVPADPLIFLRNCARIGGVELIEDLKVFR